MNKSSIPFKSSQNETTEKRSIKFRSLNGQWSSIQWVKWVKTVLPCEKKPFRM